MTEQAYYFLRNQNLRSQVLKPNQIAKYWIRDMVLNHQFCTVSLNRLRLSAVCHGCSGNAAEYFGEADIKISKSRCSLIVKSCSKSWFYIHSLISSVKALWAGTQVIYATDKSKKPEPVVFPGEQGRDSLKKVDVISKVLRKINSLPRQNIGPDYDVIHICEDLLSLTETNDDLEGNPELLDKFIPLIETFLRGFDPKKMTEFLARA